MKRTIMTERKTVRMNQQLLASISRYAQEADVSFNKAMRLLIARGYKTWSKNHGRAAGNR
jgi:hypothetical protein